MIYTSGLIDDYSFVSASSFAPLLRGSSCQRIKAENRMAGDVVLIMGDGYRYESPVPHVAVLTEKEKAFSKMGRLTDNGAEKIAIQSIAFVQI